MSFFNFVCVDFQCIFLSLRVLTLNLNFILLSSSLQIICITCVTPAIIRIFWTTYSIEVLGKFSVKLNRKVL